FPTHRLRPRSWCSNRPYFSRWPDFGSPFCSLPMTMHPHNRSIDHHIFKIRIVRQNLEDTLESSSLRPPSKSLEHRVPVPKLLRQVSPRRSGSCDPQHRLQKTPTVASRLSWISHFSQTIRLDRLPLRIVQYPACQGSSPT